MADISKINPNGTEYNLKDVAARAGIESSKTLKSSVVTVTDAAPINAEDITVDITPQQDLHGYDRPWAGGAGKNKLEVTLSSGIYSGVQWAVDSQGRINISGTVPAGGVTLNTTIADVDTTVLAGYKFILETSGSGYVYPRIMNNNLTSNLQDLSNGTIIEDNGSNCKLALRLENKGSYSKNISLMIIPPTETDATFAPYSNICPVEGWTGAELDRLGKNLIGLGTYNEESNATYTVSGSDTIVTSKESGGYKSATLDYTIPSWWSGEKFNISANATPSSTNDCRINIRTSEDGVTYTEKLNLTGTGALSGFVNIPSTAKYMKVLLYATSAVSSASGVSVTYSNLQLELGTQPTTYEPYQGQQYTASFGETVYGGKLDVKRGVLTITHVIADMGDLTWTYNNTNFVATDITGGVAKTGKTCICSCYKTVNNVPYSTNTIDDNSICMSTVTAERLYVHDSTYSDASAFKTARTGQKICYELATPTTVQLTPQQIQLLKGINTVYADCGDTQLKYQPDNVIGELKGEIRAVEAELAEVEENLEIVYEDHVANTSMGIIVDGYSVGDMPFSNALDIAKTGYTPIAVTDTSVVSSTVADQGEIATHCLLDVTNNRVRFYVHVMDSAASLTIPPNSLTFRVAYKKA